MSLNKVIIIGRLGNDPELKVTESNKSVCQMSVATSEAWKDSNGEKQERVTWHRIVVWDKQAENCNKYLKKGSQVCVEGKIQTRSWEDTEGNKRYVTEVVANSVRFLDSKSSNGVPAPSNDEKPFFGGE